MYLDDGTTPRHPEVMLARARGDERPRLERAGVGYVELVTHADEKRALDDGDGLIRRMEVGRKLIAGRHVEAHGEERALTGIRSEEHTSELQSRLHLVCR